MATQTHQERSKERMADRAKLLTQNESLRNAQADIKRKAEEARAEVDRLQQVITNAAMTGKDFSSEQALLQKVQSSLSVYEMALQQSNKQIAENNTKAEEHEKNSRMAMFEAEQEIAASQLVEAYNAGKVFLSKCEALTPTFANLERYGFKLSDYDEGRALEMFSSVLRDGIGGNNGLQARLKRLETELFVISEKAKK
jgi:hypothetical protein